MCGVWVALEDVTPTNGPLFYFPGSHNLTYMNYHDLNIIKNPLHEEAAYQEYEARLEPLMLNLGFKKKFFTPKKVTFSSGRQILFTEGHLLLTHSLPVGHRLRTTFSTTACTTRHDFQMKSWGIYTYAIRSTFLLVSP